MATGLNGTDVLLKIGQKFISGQTSSSLDETIDIIETTTKFSANKAKTKMGGEYSATMSVDCKVDPSDSTNATYEETRTTMISREAVSFIIGGTGVGDKYITGNCIISGMSAAHPQNDATTFSVSLEITGLPTTGTVTT
jgi:predicted secreted protein